MSRRRREPSLWRQFARQLVWMALILVAFYLFLAFEVYRWIGEWFAGFYQPG